MLLSFLKDAKRLIWLGLGFGIGGGIHYWVTGRFSQTLFVVAVIAFVLGIAAQMAYRWNQLRQQEPKE